MYAPVIGKQIITDELIVLRLEAPSISSSVQAGQFVNVLPRTGSIDPLLRRPFSVYQRSESWIEIILQVHGKGTRELAMAEIGEPLDVIGPLGMPWKADRKNFQTAILVIGGVGVASMPLLTELFHQDGVPLATFYGARTISLFADTYLREIHYATDDGSRGFAGTVVDLLRPDLAANKYKSPKLFVCGPTPMMKAAVRLATEFTIPCEISLETEMACGVGICQGCPVQTSTDECAATGRKFHLVCTHGPSFEREQIVL